MLEKIGRQKEALLGFAGMTRRQERERLAIVAERRELDAHLRHEHRCFFGAGRGCSCPDAGWARMWRFAAQLYRGRIRSLGARHLRVVANAQ